VCRTKAARRVGFCFIIDGFLRACHANAHEQRRPANGLGSINVAFSGPKPISILSMNKLFRISALGALVLAATFSHGAAAQEGPGLGHSGGKAAMCIGCHGIPGYKMAYPQVYHVPLIAGQNPKYIENALKAYQSGERKHPTMRSIASSLSDKDIAELAAYYGGDAK
jgi:cytochrome c553